MTAEPDPDVVELTHRLFAAARTGDEDLLADVDAGVPVDTTDSSGNTLLMQSAYRGHARLVAGLAARGADVDRLNDRGQSPLAGAVFQGQVDVVRALVAAGADPDAGHPTARESARLFNRKDLVKLLGAAKDVHR